MKRLTTIMLVGFFGLVPGDSFGFAPHRGGGGGRAAAPHPAPAARPAPVQHTPSVGGGRGAPAMGHATHTSAFIPHPAAGNMGGGRPANMGGGRPANMGGGRPANMGGGRPTNMGGGRPTNMGGGRIGGGASASRSMGGNRPQVGGSMRNMGANRASYTSRGINVSRSNGSIYRPGYAHFYNNYAGWHHGYWNGWYSRPWLWGGGGLGAGWLYSTGYANYWNPYYAADVMPFYDYGQPLELLDSYLLDQGGLDDYSANNPYAVGYGDATEDPNVTAATQLVDQARLAFRDQDYDKAQQLIDKAVKLSPKDATIHEFRALVLFARQKYAEAAATIYDVLAVAPGWDWATMQSFYANTKTYEQQLRALEAFAKSNPNDAASRFLLAYEYLVIEDKGAAIRMLQSVEKLQPKDQLAVYLLNMLNGQTGSGSAPTSGAS